MAEAIHYEALRKARILQRKRDWESQCGSAIGERGMSARPSGGMERSYDRSLERPGSQQKWVRIKLCLTLTHLKTCIIKFYWNTITRTIV